MKLDVPSTGCAIEQECLHFFPNLLARLQSLSGVVSVGAISGLPMSGYRSGWPIEIEGRPSPVDEAAMMTIWHAVTPGYFETMRIPLLRGRLFNAQDTQSSQPVILINDLAARKFWPGEDPMGKKINILGGPWRQIVGVVGDVKSNGVTGQIDPETYIPFLQVNAPTMFVVLRTRYKPQRMMGPIREDVHNIDSRVPISDMETMEDRMSEALWRQRAVTELLSLFGSLAAVLAVMGLYVVISHSVIRRIREIGVRMALGATQKNILELFVRRGMFLALAGEAAGLVLSLVLLRLIRTLLFGIQPTDPAVLISGSVLLAGMAFIACLIPAIRATRVDPSTALRHE